MPRSTVSLTWLTLHAGHCIGRNTQTGSAGSLTWQNASQVPHSPDSCKSKLFRLSLNSSQSSQLLWFIWNFLCFYIVSKEFQCNLYRPCDPLVLFVTWRFYCFKEAPQVNSIGGHLETKYKFDVGNTRAESGRTGLSVHRPTVLSADLKCSQG